MMPEPDGAKGEAMPDEFVVIDTFIHATEAETARAVLEMEGIKAFLEDGSIEGVLGFSPGGVQLAVPAAEAERARAVLDRGPLGPDVDASDDVGRDEEMLDE
jgi:hypothetical protein